MYAYSINNGIVSSRHWMDPENLIAGEVYFDAEPSPEELTAQLPGYAAAIAAQELKVSIATALAAGITIQSTGTPALNGAYKIDSASRTNIDGIYSGIKNGDGLPGSGETFNYFDIAGAPHAFGETPFLAFAKAVRDYCYALSQGTIPTSPVTIA